MRSPPLAPRRVSLITQASRDGLRLITTPHPDCHGALARAGIKRPKVTITADDPRLKRGKPFPDPFILVRPKTLDALIRDLCSGSAGC